MQNEILPYKHVNNKQDRNLVIYRKYKESQETNNPLSYHDLSKVYDMTPQRIGAIIKDVEYRFGAKK